MKFVTNIDLNQNQLINATFQKVSTDQVLVLRVRQSTTPQPTPLKFIQVRHGNLFHTPLSRVVAQESLKPLRFLSQTERLP